MALLLLLAGLSSALRPPPVAAMRPRPASDWQTAISTIREAKRNDIPCHPSIYGKAFKACGRAGRWREVLSLVDLLETEKATADDPNRQHAIAYTQAMQACGRAGQWRENTLGTVQ